MTTTVTTKLEATNVMLTAIGESPVNTITSSTTTDVSIAIQILDNVSREVQSVGWHFNTDTNYLLAKNTSNQIVLPSNCLRVLKIHNGTTDSIASSMDYKLEGLSLIHI